MGDSASEDACQDEDCLDDHFLTVTDINMADFLDEEEFNIIGDNHQRTALENLMRRTISVLLTIAFASTTAMGCIVEAEDDDDSEPEDHQAQNNDDLSGEWTLYTHPCVGHRTDALHCDDAASCFVGCGTTASGDQGFYVTDDGGATWESPTTDQAPMGESARVNDISRSSDGLLYLGGKFAEPTRVLSLSESGELTSVWERGDTIDFNFDVGAFRRAENGRAVAVSQTGVGLVYRDGDDDEWDTGYGFWDDGDDDDVGSFGVQITSLASFDDGIYGAGSTISQPPMVFLPKWSDERFDFHIVQLAAEGSEAFNGELWGIDVDDEFIVAGGVDQDSNTGVVFTHQFGDGDATDPSNWTKFDVGSLFDGHTTWIQGVCLGDDGIYVVGRESMLEWGFVLRSTDGGINFEDISPYDEGSAQSNLADAYRCQSTDDAVIVAGAEGLFAVYSDQ